MTLEARSSSISSYEYRDSVYYIDATLLLPILTGLGSFSGAGNGNTNETSKFVQELRLSGQAQLVDWVVGGYYTTEDNETGGFYVLRDLAGRPAPNNVSTAHDFYDFEESAAFGTVTLAYHGSARCLGRHSLLAEPSELRAERRGSVLRHGAPRPVQRQRDDVPGQCPLLDHRSIDDLCTLCHGLPAWRAQQQLA